MGTTLARSKEKGKEMPRRGHKKSLRLSGRRGVLKQCILISRPLNEDVLNDHLWWPCIGNYRRIPNPIQKVAIPKYANTNIRHIVRDG
jgi:hypothetical protein